MVAGRTREREYLPSEYGLRPPLAGRRLAIPSKETLRMPGLAPRRIPLWVAPALVGLALGCSGDSTGGSNPPPPPPPPPPAPVVATVEVAPDSSDVLVGESTTLTAVARDAQGAQVAGTSFSWATDDGAIATVSSTGEVTAVAVGKTSVTATAAGKIGTATIVVRPDTLVGASGASAPRAIVTRRFIARDQDYSTGAPDLPGLELSFNTVTVSIEPTATVGQVNGLLRDLGADIVGGRKAADQTMPGHLVLRLPTKSHAEMLTRLETIRQHPGVRRAARDVILGPTVLPKGGANIASGWSYGLQAGGGNWGLEEIRAPAMWNLNRAVAEFGRRTRTGIFDDGPSQQRDIVIAGNLTPSKKLNHGTQVAGIIAATFDNAEGIEGVTPFADLYVAGIRSYGEVLASVLELFPLQTDVAVLNLSLGYNWYSASPPVDFRTNLAAQRQANDDGETFTEFLADLAQQGRRLPVVVAAAGNDAGTFIDADARYATPFANAGLAQGAAPVIVVEASDVGPIRAAFSNLGGHLSAPGVDIQSTRADGSYQVPNDEDDGTSFAAPFVTGLVSYLYSLDPNLPAPTMTTNPIRDLLVANGVTAFGLGAPRIDAFATVMDVDRVQGNTRVLKLLTDIDDGSVDGNLRLDAGGLPNFDEDIDHDGQPGDGVVDMADFRRWRDWLLQAEGTSLDGAPDHPKKDLNGDEVVGTATAENVHPRGDFNGDGKIHRGQKAPVRGALGGRSVTDLEVLQELFDDPNYQKTDLPALIDSYDLEVVGATCLAVGTAVSVDVTVKPFQGSSQLAHRVLDHVRPTSVITLAVSVPDVTVVVEARDDLGNPVGSSQISLSGSLGSHEGIEPDCASHPVQITTQSPLPNGELNVPYSQQLTAVGGVGSFTWSVVGGTLAPGLGLTSTGLLSGTPTAAGRFVASVKAVSGTESDTRSIDLTINDPIAGHYSGPWTLAGMGTSQVPASGSIGRNASGAAFPYNLRIVYGGAEVNCPIDVVANEPTLTANKCTGSDVSFGKVSLVSGSVTRSTITMEFVAQSKNPYVTMTLTRDP
jgi:hypothetical protein